MSFGGDFSRKNFKYPECWSDDIRMNALFAPFRSKSVNSTDFNSKMKFWTNLIDSWCKHSNCPVIEISSLKNSFSRKGLAPACLEDVILHLRSSKIIILKDKFMASNDSWMSWGIKVLVTNPLNWTFNTVKNTIISTNEEKKIYYIHLPVIKHLSEQIMKKISSCHGKLINFEDLKELSEIKSDENLSLVLHQLQNQGNAAIFNENMQTLIKLSKSTSNQQNITETDKVIYSLEQKAKLVKESIVKLEEEEKVALKETKKHLAAKMKNLAKISLRRKKEIGKTIEKRAIVLENIEGILRQIDQTKFDSEVVDCYQKGIATLKRIFKESGIDEETVTSTMDELKDVLSSRNEIEEALSQPFDPDSLQELQDELNELMLSEVPSVPEDEIPVDGVPVKVANDNKKAKSVVDELEARVLTLSI